jgi:hypothetical protein
VSVEAHQVAIQRMIAAGANMMTWLALAAEWPGIATQTSVHSPAMTSWVRPVALTASTTVRSSQDRTVVDAVRATGRTQLVIAGLWTEVCVAMPAIQA